MFSIEEFFEENEFVPGLVIGIIILLLVSLLIGLIIRFCIKRKNKKESYFDKNNFYDKNDDNIQKKDKQKHLDELIKKNEALKNELVEQTNAIRNKEIDLISKEKEYLDKLLNISKLNIDDIKKEIINIVELELKKDKANLIREFNKQTSIELKEKMAQILVSSMESIDDDLFINKTSYSLKLNDESIKGRIIGKDGRNKKTFETITGVDLVIEKDSSITVSCFNPIRREIAKNLLEKLIENKNIEPSRIEKYYEQEKIKIEKIINEKAIDVVENKLQMFDINKSLYPYIGKLFFRTSYSQNILQHSKECAMLAVSIARELKLDEEKAKRAAFFHDIGKSIDFEIDNDHVESGLKLAQEFNLPDYVCNAIESHHDKVPPNNIYSAIVKIVDAISASRPGARLTSYEEYIKKVTSIESICDSFEGVTKSYVVRAGKQVRIIIDPLKISDDELELLSHNIKTKLENDPIINKQPIDLIFIREKRIEIKSDGMAKRVNN